MWPLAQVAPKGVHWMQLPNVSAALCHMHSRAGGSLTKLHHNQVSRAAKSNTPHDGRVFTMEEPPSGTAPVATPSPSPSPSQLGAAAPLLHFSWLPWDALAVPQTFVVPSTLALGATRWLMRPTCRLWDHLLTVPYAIAVHVEARCPPTPLNVRVVICVCMRDVPRMAFVAAAR